MVSSFIDDGKSAKNFDRPDWKKLEDFIKVNKVDYLIVMKYDRFSRNLSESLQKLEMLEMKYNIRVISVMEPIGIHPKNPMYFEMRTNFLLRAQTEWLVIRDRTKFGINTAQKAGRYLNRAPIGYKNAKDNQNKPIIVIDEIKAKIIRGIFSKFIHGETTYNIGIWAKENGFNLEGKSSIVRVLTNPTYAGLIKVNQFYDDAERLIKGLHEPIVTEETYYRVQNILNYSEKRERTILSDEMPLRSKLLCYCGRPLTGAPSKGKNKYYYYYKCNTHYQINLPAMRLNNQMQQIFDNLGLPERTVQAVKLGLDKYLKEHDVDNTALISEKNKQLNQVQKQIDSLERKYLMNEFPYESYEKWKVKLDEESYVLKTEISNRQQFNKGIKYDVDSLLNMGSIYKVADTVQKQSLLNGVFNNTLYYYDGIYRTPYMLELFQSKALILKEKRLLEYEKPLDYLADLPARSPNVTSIEHFLNFLRIVSEIKKVA